MADEADKAQAQMEEWERLQDKARLARMASDIQALAAVDCIECGAPIGEARKAANPGATRCIECENAREIKGRGYGRTV